MTSQSRFSALAAPGVRGLHPYQPGKPIEELEREYGVSDTLKLASNENPLGPPAAALAAIRDAAATLNLYPDGAGHLLKLRLAERHGVAPEQITLGNGSNDVLVLLAETFLTPELEAVYDRHAFVVYALAVQEAGATARMAVSLPATDPAQPLGHDPHALAECCGPLTRLVYVANPNNPTGTWLSETAIRWMLDELPPDALLVLDEAYAEYVSEGGYPDGVALLADYPNLVVTRTFSKAFALAGLRIGYAVSHPEVAELMNRVRQPFNTSTLAQAAALAALEDREFIDRSRTLNAEGLQQLTGGLRSMGLGVPPSVGNFVLADLGRPVAPVYEALLREGIIVRPVGNYGLPNHLRITVGLPEQNERLLAVLPRCLESGL
ncbi:MAG: histidinol-phosphate transaminase [Chromatiales bacterium]|nr:MAG: histidinol-phosphate transaminase [Chromatiales bacterium]